jgi:hypothetical protein
MKNLNEDNGAAPILLKYVRMVGERFPNPMAAELGIAWGGGVEAIGKIWNGKGKIYGFDTFEGHPKDLSYSPSAHESYCMDPQYQTYGMEGLSYEYQRKELDRQGLSNVILVKGRINQNSFSDNGIMQLHYCLLDLDMINPMAMGLTLALPVMASGGYLCLHGAVPRGHIFGLWGLYQEVMAGGQYRVIEEATRSYLVVLQRK